MVGTQYVLLRSLHVLGGGLLLGGSAVLWLAIRADEGVSVRAVTWFEAAFWGVFGVIVFTGIGNLVGFGTPTAGRRELTLTVKLSSVLVIAAVSIVRSFAVVERLRREVRTVTERRLGTLYAATAWLAAVVIVLAGVLARG
jgi:hypothetical protein